MSTLPARSEESGARRPGFQFTIRTLLVVMFALGLACTLTPTRLRSGPLSALMQVLWVVYLMIGFGQAYLCAPSRRQRNQPTSEAPSRFAKGFRFGGLLTLPMWVLVVVTLFVWKWADVSVFEQATVIFVVWLIVASLGQILGSLFNLQVCFFLLVAHRETESKPLAILNAINAVVFVLVLCGGGFMELF